MHVLTKALVIFAAILAVALSALVIAYAVNTDRISADFGNERRSRFAAEASLAAQLGDANAMQTRLMGQLEQANRELADAKARTANLETEKTVLAADKAKAEAAAQQIANKIAELGETAKTQAEIIKNYREEVTTLRNNELTYRKNQADLDERINELESQNEVLTQNYRALQEQLAEAKRSQDSLVAGGPGGSADQPFSYSGPPIQGRIESIQRDPTTNKLVAKINVGTNNRVAKNMQFAIVRGNEFLANFVVTEPDLRWSLGEVNTLGRTIEIKEGDLVTSRLQ